MLGLRQGLGSRGRPTSRVWWLSCGGLELIEDVTVVHHVAAYLSDVDGVGVVQLLGELTSS